MKEKQDKEMPSMNERDGSDRMSAATNAPQTSPHNGGGTNHLIAAGAEARPAPPAAALSAAPAGFFRPRRDAVRAYAGR